MIMIYKGDFIAGANKYHKALGLREGHWYTWDCRYLRPATETERAAGAGAY